MVTELCEAEKQISTPVRSFTIDPNEAGGWRLRMKQDGEEIGGGAFMADEYSDALDHALDWYGSPMNSNGPEESFIEMERRTR